MKKKDKSWISHTSKERYFNLICPSTLTLIEHNKHT